MNVSANYVSDIIDEIALEGLDGITLDALWKRLSVRQNFCFKIDENSKNFIWNVCKKVNNLRFYELPENRKQLQYYDFSALQKEQKDANLELDAIYPYSSIKNDSRIFGSCQYFSVRKDITDNVAHVNRLEAEESFGDKLVIVASQESRNQALLGNTSPPNVDFSKSRMQYDILERIGRCRSLGIPTHGKGSLQSVAEDSKSVFHYLKFLIKHKIVKKQSLLGSLQANPNGSKIYLSRYYGEFINDYQIILQTAIEELKSRPNYRMTYEEFYQLFDPDKKMRVKKYSKSAAFRKYIMVSKLLPYREFFPDAPQAEWERKCKFGEKIVRCFQLIDPNTDVADLFEKECDSDEEDGNAASDFLTTETYYKGIPLVQQTYYHVKNSGSHGITIRELAEAMGLTRSFIRSILKRLIQEKHCKCFEEISGRRHSKRYMVGENAKNIAATTEIFQILSENSDGNKEKECEKTENVKQKMVNATDRKVEYQSLEDDNVPYRTLRRIGMIIRTIKAHRYRLFFQIYKHVLEEEIKEGLTATACRTSVNRILQKLEKDGLIKIIDISQGDDKNTASVKIYTEPTFVLDDKLTETILHAQTSYKTVDHSKPLNKEDVQMERVFGNILLENLAQMKKMLIDVKAKCDKTNPKETKDRELTCSPKFIRLNIIHDFMFYLVYDYTGITDRTQGELLKELSKTCDIDEDLKREMPDIYGTQLTNYLFVPPLRAREGTLTGWFIMSDLLIRMPLSIFVKIIRVHDTTPDLLNYLNHPIRKHFLIKDLPVSIRQTLFKRFQYIVSFSSNIKRLCFLGLVQYGVKCGKEQYQTFLYLNRNASLLDTTSSPSGYLHVPSDVQFPVKRYKFDSKNDIKKYWQDMCNICLATNLGVKANMIGKEVLAVREMSKESLRKFSEAKTPSKAAADDDGRLPGDQLGAGGIDSVMFSFLRSNWIGPVLKANPSKPNPLKKVPLQKLKRDLARKKQRIHLQKSRLKKHGKKPEVVIPRPVIAEGIPASNRTRKVKERELRFKRTKKTYYDEVDIEALKMKNTLRVTWSPAEDHLLLICQVAISYLCPNPRAFFRIPWSEVRCNLQKNLTESRDKTQKAIARRIKYMMKHPTTDRSVSLCLEELHQIPEVAERFNCTQLMRSIKPSAPNLAELQKELYEKFHSLVAYVKRRFAKGSSFNVGETENDLLPDTLDDFRNHFELETESPNENPTLKDIRESVIRAIVMSSLSCRADKTSSAIQLFEIYRQYEDDELQRTVKRLNSDKVIVVKKTNTANFKKGKYLPLSHSPCKLSFSFQTLLNMKYSHSLYPDSFNVINKLLQSKEVDGFHVDLNECNVPLYVLACVDLVTFRTTVPEQIIVLDSDNSMDKTAYAKMLKRYCEMLKFSNSESKYVCTSGKLLTTTGKRTADDDDDEERNIKKVKLEPNGDVQTVESLGANEMNEMNDGGRRGKCGAGSWRIVLYMMREEAKKEINNFTGSHAQEFFVVNASQVHCTRMERLDHYAKEMNPKAVAALIKDIISQHLVPLSLVREDEVIKEFRKKGENVDVLKKILEFIYASKELGATNKDLRLNFDANTLPMMMQHLVESKIVIRTGIKETRYVGQKYCTPWVLNSFRMTRLEREKMKPSELSAIEILENGSEEEAPLRKKKKGIITSEQLKSDDYTPPTCSTEMENKVKILIRPWMRIDGSLNRKVLDRFLGSVLGFVMVNPGITVRSIMDKFSPSLIPVWTKDLVEILHKIGCVSFKTFMTITRATLFSREEVICSDTFNGLDDDENIVVEAKIDAIITLGLFIGKKTYSKDFLTE